jgi:hypothetical protein
LVYYFLFWYDVPRKIWQPRSYIHNVHTYILFVLILSTIVEKSPKTFCPNWRFVKWAPCRPSRGAASSSFWRAGSGTRPGKTWETML